MSSDTIYDHPRYYDVLFGFDRSVEADFYARTFERYGVARGAPVLEVGAGPLASDGSSRAAAGG